MPRHALFHAVMRDHILRHHHLYCRCEAQFLITTPPDAMTKWAHVRILAVYRHAAKARRRHRRSVMVYSLHCRFRHIDLFCNFSYLPHDEQKNMQGILYDFMYHTI